MMRTRAAFGFAAAVVLASTSAFATDTGKGETGGKGGLGPGESPTPASGGADVVPLGNGSQNANADTAARRVEKEKPWEVGATFETHRLIRQDDLEGVGANKVFNDFGVYATYKLTDNDRLGLREYFYERFLADEGETGFRSDDVTATYTRTQKLPKNFSFAATVAINAPTSFTSQEMGLITAPGLVLQLDKKIGRYIGLSARASTGFFIVKYREMEGGQPNPEFRLGFSLEAEVIMPFHEALSLGIDATTSYLWFYNVASGDPSVVANGVVNDATFPNQPISQSYGGEIFARYNMPNLAGVKSDLTLSLAQGDPSLGYASVLHDGVGYTYLFFRQTSEVYASFTVRY
jgi:hypothetical protein